MHQGVGCNSKLTSVKKVILDNLLLPGTFDAVSLCAAKSLTVLSLTNNTITGEIPQETGNCTQLTHLYLSGNKLSGSFPVSLSHLNNLKRLDISDNFFSGALPDFTIISAGLVSFLVQNNSLTGKIPQFDFENIISFNVSFNYFTGPVPDLKGRFSVDSLLGNPGLCGYPLPNKCPPSK
ncbi:probable inactive receptor kinase At2g26730 [Papaver somniferum]|uniref:probable inactive receptor kinase At2g26730 n=1 Tax=Papaver somniferum TaxID=3469 RepID=UPI000E6FA142|nr:probable inactive receptor kinase At2g26730 [Papaver somniferum]